MNGYNNFATSNEVVKVNFKRILLQNCSMLGGYYNSHGRELSKLRPYTRLTKSTYMKD